MKWFRLYTDVIHDPKVQRLQPQLFKDWINVLCLAAEHDGKIPAVIPDIAFTLHLSEVRTSKLLEDLRQAGLLVVSETTITPHNWEKRQYKSDVSTERVKRFRNAKRNAPETPSDADADADADSETEPDGEKRARRAPSMRKRDPEMLANVAGLMHAYFDGTRPKPDVFISRRVHDALGDPVTWPRIEAFRDFISNKLHCGFKPDSYGIFLSWAEMVGREFEGGEYASSGD